MGSGRLRAKHFCAKTVKFTPLYFVELTVQLLYENIYEPRFSVNFVFNNVPISVNCAKTSREGTTQHATLQTWKKALVASKCSHKAGKSSTAYLATSFDEYLDKLEKPTSLS